MTYRYNYYSKISLNSFDEVAKKYEETKPLRGARASENIRPLTNRAYWWNRISKVSDTKYILCDGHWAWSTMPNDCDIREQTAPIVWERKDDGDYLTIRSHMNDGMSVSRYTFLDKWLPKEMRFIWPNGKHYVTYRGEQHYVPKFRGKMDWSNKTFEMYEDHKVVFIHKDGEFTRVNEKQPFKTKKIDKQLDAYYDDKLKAFWEWAQVTLPILGETIVTNRHQYAEKLTDGGSFWYWKRVDPTHVRNILTDEEHECRMALAVCLANDTDALLGNRFAEKNNTYSLVRKAVRQVADFYLTEARQENGYE